MRSGKFAENTMYGSGWYGLQFGKITTQRGSVGCEFAISFAADGVGDWKLKNWCYSPVGLMAFQYDCRQRPFGNPIDYGALVSVPICEHTGGVDPEGTQNVCY
jgi:hypothetical protein